MKMNKITFLSAVCATMMFSACSSDDDVAGKSEPQVLHLATTLDEQVTRAKTSIQSTQFVKDRYLTVFTFTGTGTNTKFQNKQVKMKADGFGNIVDNTSGLKSIYYDPLTSVNAWVICPFFNTTNYPFSETEDKNFDYKVNTDQSTDENYCVSDLCSGYLYGARADGKTNYYVPMKHLYSKVTVNILPGDDGYTLAESDISSIVINAKASGTMKCSKLQAEKNTNPILSVSESAVAKEDIIVGKATLSCSAILPPQTIASGSALVKVTLTNGVVWTFTYDSALTLESGKAYKINLKPNRPIVGQNTGGTQDITVNIVNWTTVNLTYDYQLNK